MEIISYNSNEVNNDHYLYIINDDLVASSGHDNSTISLLLSNERICFDIVEYWLLQVG